MGIYYEAFNFANFAILNALAKIKAYVAHNFGSMYLLYVPCCEYNIQKLQIFLLRADLGNLQIFLLAINSHYMVFIKKNLLYFLAEILLVSKS